jgi:hypothetical protein
MMATRSHERRIGVGVFLMIALTCALSAQEPRPEQSTHSLRVNVDLVEVNATVTDGKGRFVTGLEKEDFEVFEDKVRQDITHFYSEDVPFSV